MSLIFIVGFERCGTHTIINVLKSSCRVSGYMAHEDKPHLCEEAYAFTSGNTWKTKHLANRLDKLAWLEKRIRVVCEANHRFGYFVRELNTLSGAKFILLVRDPIQTLISRVATLQHWPDILDRYPAFYQEAARTRVAPGK